MVTRDRTNPFRRTFLTSIVLGAIAWLVLPIAPAGAAPPIRDRSTGSFDDALPAEVCGFVILAHIDQNVTMKVSIDANGNMTRARSTGLMVVTLTNADTGAQARLHLPGPGNYDQNFDLVSGSGPWATFTPDGTFVITTGHTTFVDGVAVDMTGHQTDVCSLLS